MTPAYPMPHTDRALDAASSELARAVQSPYRAVYNAIAAEAPRLHALGAAHEDYAHALHVLGDTIDRQGARHVVAAEEMAKGVER
jgi:hypothetical protein